MALQCNIDRRGRIARLIWGLLLLVVGVVLGATWAWPSGSWLAWTVTIVTFGGGLFAIFEARRGWCVMRAMGVRTPM